MLKKIVFAAIVASAVVSIAPSASAEPQCELGLPGCESPTPQSTPEPSSILTLVIGGGYVAQRIIRGR